MGRKVLSLLLALLLLLGLVPIQSFAIPPPLPLFVSAATNATGTKVTILFDKAMADPSADFGNFTVEIHGISYDSPVTASVAISSAALNADPTMIDLMLGAPVQRGDIITVKYAPGTVMAADGAILGAFCAQPVTNTIPVIIVTNLPGTWQIFDHVGNWQEDPFPTGDDPRGNVFNRHIVVIGNAVYFYGNGVHPFKDFLYLPSSEAAAKSFTFNLDLGGIKYHSMEGGGFLFNTKIDGGLLSGYCALFTITGRVNNIDTYAVKLYKIDGVDVATFHDGIGSYFNLGASAPGITSLGSFPLSTGNLHTITLESSSSSVDMWDGNTKLIDNFALPTVFSNGVGIIGSYQPHDCNELSYFIFSNLNIQGIADLSAALVGVGYEANLTFTAPEGATAVSVEQSTNGTTWVPSTLTTGPITAASTTATVNGLTGNQTYYFRLVITGGKYVGYSRMATAAYDGSGVPVPTPTPIPAPIAPVPKNVNLLVTIEGPGKVYPPSGPYSQNSIVVMSVVPNDGASFVGWFGDNAAEVVDNRITMNEGKSIIGRFAVPEVIPVPVLPQSPPAVLPVITPTPAPVVIPEVEVPVVVVPEAAPVLPKTAGMPIELFGLLGSGMLGAGFLLRSKKK